MSGKNKTKNTKRALKASSDVSAPHEDSVMTSADSTEIKGGARMENLSGNSHSGESIVSSTVPPVVAVKPISPTPIISDASQPAIITVVQPTVVPQTSTTIVSQSSATVVPQTSTTVIAPTVKQLINVTVYTAADENKIISTKVDVSSQASLTKFFGEVEQMFNILEGKATLECCQPVAMRLNRKMEGWQLLIARAFTSTDLKSNIDDKNQLPIDLTTNTFMMIPHGPNRSRITLNRDHARNASKRSAGLEMNSRVRPNYLSPSAHSSIVPDFERYIESQKAAGITVGAVTVKSRMNSANPFEDKDDDDDDDDDDSDTEAKATTHPRLSIDDIRSLIRDSPPTARNLWDSDKRTHASLTDVDAKDSQPKLHMNARANAHANVHVNAHANAHTNARLTASTSVGSTSMSTSATSASMSTSSTSGTSATSASMSTSTPTFSSTSASSTSSTSDNTFSSLTDVFSRNHGIVQTMNLELIKTFPQMKGFYDVSKITNAFSIEMQSLYLMMQVIGHTQSPVIREFLDAGAKLVEHQEQLLAQQNRDALDLFKAQASSLIQCFLPNLNNRLHTPVESNMMHDTFMCLWKQHALSVCESKKNAHLSLQANRFIPSDISPPKPHDDNQPPLSMLQATPSTSLPPVSQSHLQSQSQSQSQSLPRQLPISVSVNAGFNRPQATKK